MSAGKNIQGRQLQVLHLLRMAERLSTAAVAEHLGIAASTAYVHLRELRLKGMIMPTGLGQGTVWCLGTAVPRALLRASKLEQRYSSVWDYAQKLAKDCTS